MIFHEMIYSTPRGGKRKELFPSFFPRNKKICQRGREDAVYSPDRRPQNPQDPPHHPGDPVQPAAEKGAEEGEVTGGSQQQAQGHIQPHPAVPKDHAAVKQPPAGPHPEEKVQSLLENAPGERQPQPPEQVIEEAHPRPHGQGEDQGGDLLFQRDAHPRNSRPRKLPCWGSSSS